MSYLSLAQIAIAVLLVAAILLQQRGGGLGGAFGGEGGGFYAARRGLQRKLYWASVVLGTLFVLLALANLVA
ncbi:MAG: preprotein translocase subunit SecG [Candidatus Wildermuthbacteria bacterium RIFCSPHIGHO2_01_FULL_49_22b]|uniref:Protein-export membrane protein SecG n=1 Tax=Candidatus Wildermuthbacteria bacterium RIFCSPHIGHO2_01_FULL_49_22b TaxID=1802448 RepID=A0A1G2QZG9_9BACT|nr:MAG: preprotein translocase subunit SecG [Candidatus Wildermuthbacteria bacterium RIFCSPHIGHO2_01_FULL_49_22b]